VLVLHGSRGRRRHCSASTGTGSKDLLKDHVCECTVPCLVGESERRNGVGGSSLCFKPLVKTGYLSFLGYTQLARGCALSAAQAQSFRRSHRILPASVRYSTADAQLLYSAQWPVNNPVKCWLLLHLFLYTTNAARVETARGPPLVGEFPRLQTNL
jgi:hypothetical protein